MKTSPILFCLKYGLFLLVFFLMGCKEQQGVVNGVETSLKVFYQRLSLTKTGKNYPPRQEIVEDCKKYKSSCLKTYQLVQDAKKELLAKISTDPKQTLTFTLDTICQKCSKNEHEIAFEDEQECLGAITALFFFNQENQDKIIMDRLLKASPQVIEWNISFRFEWFYNRPNPQRWIDALEELPDDRLNQDLRETMIQRIKDSVNNPEKFGIML